MERRFANPAHFRASVDERLRAYARRTGVPLTVVRRQAALERLIARLGQVAPDRWALKGGLALDTRLSGRARASMDMDADHAQGAEAARVDLLAAAEVDLGDYFEFALAGSRALREGDLNLATRFRLECSVGGVLFDMPQVDATLTPPDVWEVERAQRPGLLASVGLGPIEVLLVPLERQVAEKLHAYTRTYGKDRTSTRVRDLVDLLLIRTFERVDALRLLDAIRRTFERRATHPVPEHVPPPPADWQRAYREEAEHVGITPEVAEAHRLVGVWLDAVLRGAAKGSWDPERGMWEHPGP